MHGARTLKTTDRNLELQLRSATRDQLIGTYGIRLSDDGQIRLCQKLATRFKCSLQSILMRLHYVGPNSESEVFTHIARVFKGKP
jgi:hypothetical protein